MVQINYVEPLNLHTLRLFLENINQIYSYTLWGNVIIIRIFQVIVYKVQNYDLNKYNKKKYFHCLQKGKQNTVAQKYATQSIRYCKETIFKLILQHAFWWMWLNYPRFNFIDFIRKLWLSHVLSDLKLSVVNGLHEYSCSCLSIL